MNRSIKKAGLGATILAAATLFAPLTASAGGDVTFVLEPKGKDARMVQQGLQIYSMVSSFDDKKKKNHASVIQKGKNNAAAVGQKGKNNYGLVYQNGKNHTATVDQAGRNNALGVFQFGKGGDLDVGQYGRNKTGLVFQIGW